MAGGVGQGAVAWPQPVAQSRHRSVRTVSGCPARDRTTGQSRLARGVPGRTDTAGAPNPVRKRRSGSKSFTVNNLSWLGDPGELPPYLLQRNDLRAKISRPRPRAGSNAEGVPAA